MKRMLSLIVIGALVAPALPMAAEENLVRTVGASPTAPRIDVIQPSAGIPARPPRENEDTVLLDWWRVRKLKPGRELRFMAPDATPITRYFVSADERALTVVNVDQPRLSRKASKAIIELLSHNPGAFLRTEHGELVMNDGRVRVAPEGLFVDRKKVADRDEFIQTIARADVQQSVAIGQARPRGLSPVTKLAIGVAVTIGTLMILSRFMMPTG